MVRLITLNPEEPTLISTAATAAAKTKALKDIEALKKAIQELDDYERDILYPLATEKLEIDAQSQDEALHRRHGQ